MIEKVIQRPVCGHPSDVRSVAHLCLTGYSGVTMCAGFGVLREDLARGEKAQRMVYGVRSRRAGTLRHKLQQDVRSGASTTDREWCWVPARAASFKLGRASSARFVNN